MYLYLSTRYKLNPGAGMARSGTLSFSSSPSKRTGGHEHHREQAKQSQNLFIASDDVLMLAISFSVHKVDLCEAIPHGTMAPPHRRSCLHIVPSRAKDILAYGLQPLPNVSSQIGSNFFLSQIFSHLMGIENRQVGLPRIATDYHENRKNRHQYCVSFPLAGRG